MGRNQAVSPGSRTSGPWVGTLRTWSPIVMPVGLGHSVLPVPEQARLPLTFSGARKNRGVEVSPPSWGKSTAGQPQLAVRS